MILFTIAGATVVIFTALINWRMSAECAKKPTRFVVAMWNIYTTFTFLFLFICFPQPIIDVVLFILGMLLVNHLLFITTVYIPYSKKSIDVGTLRNTIRQAIVFNIAIITALVMLIFFMIYLPMQ